MAKEVLAPLQLDLIAAPAQGTKKCKVCLREKSVADFNKSAAYRDGLAHLCRACQGERAKRYYRGHRREKILKAAKRWRLENPEEIARSKRRWQLRKLYGITLETYEALVADREHKCDLCGKAKHRWLGVDHDHETGDLRGLLCTACNMALARLGDTEESLLRVVHYLQNPPLADIPRDAWN